METIKQALFTGWNFMRWLRLGFGIFFSVQAFQTHDTLISFVAAFFLLTAITNTGCCGNKSCAVRHIQKKSSKSEEAGFGEIIK
jgi:hypothetical protein